MHKILTLVFVMIICGYSFSESDSTSISAKLEEARALFNKDPQKGCEKAKQALQNAYSINNQWLVSKALNTIGSSMYYLGFPDSSYRYHSSALQIQKTLDDYEGMGRSYTNIGIYLTDKGKHREAIEYLLKAEKMFLKINYRQGLGKIYNNLGVLFYNLRDFENGLNSYQKSYKIARESRDSLLMYSALTNMASCYYGKNNRMLALVKYYEALELARKLGNQADVILLMNNIVPIHIEYGEYEKALKMNNEAMSICKNMQLDNFYKISIYENYGRIHLSLNKLELAGRYADSAIIIARRANVLNRVPELYALKIKTLSKDGLNSEIAKYVSALVFLKDSLYSEQMKAQVNEINTKYEVSKKEDEIRNFQLEQGYQKKVKLLLYVIIAAAVVLLIFFIFSFWQKSKDNKLINRQKEVLEEKNHLIGVKQKEILDSINYAKRIQYTLLAHEAFLKEHLPEHFTYFNPKDIVSGDFYWATSAGSGTTGKFYLAVCDSTGHGVPGAFMSLLNIGFLNEAINEKGIEKPNEVFDYVREKLTNTISKEGQKDGFDGILLCFDASGKTITYAAANNAPVLIRNGMAEELAADRMPVGIGERKENFSLHTIQAEAGDMLYLYTDGYADQFGGPKGKKFKYKQLNELLLALNSKPVNDQHTELSQAFNRWKGDLEQVDDVCVIGIKL